MSIPSSPTSPSVIPVYTSIDTPSTPAASTTPSLVSTLTAAEQQKINAIVTGSLPLSPSTTAFFEAALVGLNDIAQQMHLSDFMDALRALQSQTSTQSLAQAFQLIQEQLMVNFKAAMINLDDINQQSDEVNNDAANLSNSVSGYNSVMGQLQTYANAYNQAQANLQQATSNYNGSSSSISNYQNAANAFNTAANNYNNFRSSILNAQPGQSNYAVQQYQSNVDAYNTDYSNLVSSIQSKNTQINQLNATNLAQNPLYPQAPTQPLPTAPLGQVVTLPLAQTLNQAPDIASNSPPPNSLPQPIFSAYNPIGFTFSQTSSSPPSYSQAPYPSSQLNTLIQQWNSTVSTFNTNLSQMQSQVSVVKSNLSALNTQANMTYTTNPKTNQFNVNNYNTAASNYNTSVATYNNYANNLNTSLSTLQSLSTQINGLLAQGQGVQIPESTVQSNGGYVPDLSFNFISSGLGSTGSSQTVDLPPPVSTVSTSTPPSQTTLIPQQISSNFTPVSFTAPSPLPVTPTSFDLELQFSADLHQLYVNFIAVFASLDQAIQTTLKGRVDQSLVLLHSFLTSNLTPQTPQSETGNSNVQASGSSGLLSSSASNSTDSENMINQILQNQTYQDVLNSVASNHPALQQILGGNGLPQNMQLQLIALLGASRATGSVLSVQALQNLIQSGGNVSDLLNNVTNAVSLLQVFLAGVQGGSLQNAAGVVAPTGTTPVTPTTPTTGTTADQPGNVVLQGTLTALLLAAAFLGQATNNTQGVLSQLLVALNTATTATTATVAQNLSQLLAKLSTQQTAILQQQLQSALTSALSSSNVSPDTISELSQDLANATSPQDIEDAIDTSLADVNASDLQSSLDAINLTTSLTDLDTQNLDIDSSDLASNLVDISNDNADITSTDLNASNVLSGVINDQTQQNIQNAVALNLQSNNIPNATSIATTIASSVAEISTQQLPTSSFVTQVNNAIQQALGTSGNSSVQNTTLSTVNNTLFSQNITQSILANLQNQNLVNTTTNVSNDLAALVNQIGTSFSQNLHEVAQANDDDYLKKTVENFQATIVNLSDFNTFVQQVLNPGKTMVGLMYEGMKEGFHKGWLDFAV